MAATGYPRSRVLMTGGTGLIGRSAAARLSDLGCEVIVSGRLERPPELPRDVTYARCDLLDAGATKALVRDAKADVLIHLAWVTEHGRFWSSPDNLDWVAASLHLARAFAENGGRRIVAAGTCVEYDPPEQGPCICGETAVTPAHLYGVAKDSLHRLLASYCEQAGLSLAWGRIFLLIGPGEAPGRLVPSIVRNMLSGKPAECSSGRQVRDFLDVRDCGEAFAALAMSPFQGPINICSGQPLTIAEVAQATGRLLGSPDLLRLGALPDRTGEPGNLWGDATPLRVDCGFVPNYTLERSLTDAIDYWRRIAAQ